MQHIVWLDKWLYLEVKISCQQPHRTAQAKNHIAHKILWVVALRWDPPGAAGQIKLLAWYTCYRSSSDDKVTWRVNVEDGRLTFDCDIAWQPGIAEEKSSIDDSTFGNIMLFDPATKLSIDDIGATNMMEYDL